MIADLLNKDFRITLKILKELNEKINEERLRKWYVNKQISLGRLIKNRKKKQNKNSGVQNNNIPWKTH